jgi:serine/threonine protein kinase
MLKKNGAGIFDLKLIDSEFVCRVREESAVGTTAYLPPEYFDYYYPRYELVKERDVWTVGVVLFAFNFGQLPFNDPSETMYTEIQHLDVFREPHYMKTVPVSARDLILSVCSPRTLNSV